MAGYLLLERRMLRGFGIHVSIGILDFLRDMRGPTLLFDRDRCLRIVGLEDVLLAAGDHQHEVAISIHNMLARRANELEKLGKLIQVEFRWPLRLADDFWVEAGPEKHLSLRPIFGRPARAFADGGIEYYIASFTLT